MFTFKSSSIEEEGAEDGATEKEMEDLAAIQAERILQVHKNFTLLSSMYLSLSRKTRFQWRQDLFFNADVYGEHDNVGTEAKQGFLNKTFIEENNGSARVMYILVDILDPFQNKNVKLSNSARCFGRMWAYVAIYLLSIFYLELSTTHIYMCKIWQN